jgi:hypothetical protein
MQEIFKFKFYTILSIEKYFLYFGFCETVVMTGWLGASTNGGNGGAGTGTDVELICPGSGGAGGGGGGGGGEPAATPAVTVVAVVAVVVFCVVACCCSLISSLISFSSSTEFNCLLIITLNTISS